MRNRIKHNRLLELGIYVHQHTKIIRKLVYVDGNIRIITTVDGQLIHSRM
jgi:hypothetical protein